MLKKQKPGSDVVNMFSNWQYSSKSVHKKLDNECYDVVMSVLADDRYLRDIVSLVSMSIYEYIADNFCNRCVLIEGLRDINSDQFLVVDGAKLNSVI